MKGFVTILLLFWGLNASAKLPTMREIFLSLPDTAFAYGKSFTKSKTFSVAERQQLLKNSDTALLRIEFESDSLHQMTLSGGDYVSIQIKYWVKSKKEIFIAVIGSRCDFVMCHQSNMFYDYDGHSFLSKKNQFMSAPMSYFFTKEELKKCGFNPDSGCDHYIFFIENNMIRVNFQSEYLDKELMGDDGTYVCLNPENSKLFSQSVYYEWNGKKFKLKIVKSVPGKD